MRSFWSQMRRGVHLNVLHIPIELFTGTSVDAFMQASADALPCDPDYRWLCQPD